MTRIMKLCWASAADERLSIQKIVEGFSTQFIM